MPPINQRLGFTRFEADEYYKQALEAFKKNDFDNAIDAMKNAIERAAEEGRILLGARLDVSRRRRDPERH